MYRCPACGALNRISPPLPSGTPLCGRCRGTLDLSGKPQAVDGEALSRAVVSSPIPVLLDLWAPWCGPCRAAAPLLDALGRSSAGKLLVLKLNTEEHPEAASSLGVRGIPCFVLYANGREVARRSGLMPAAEMNRWLTESLGGGAGMRL
ncbi:thioredoxin family protein [Stigmatella aurantiaca]|nr:thioredoxin domain-containing protein [Stigmatella aurantiaca]EAU61833.1 thioredoxin 2 [Stigmatella aurantiaca DW4/3-1]